MIHGFFEADFLDIPQKSSGLGESITIGVSSTLKPRSSEPNWSFRIFSTYVSNIEFQWLQNFLRSNLKILAKFCNFEPQPVSTNVWKCFKSQDWLLLDLGLLHHQNQYHFFQRTALRLGFKFSPSRNLAKFRATLDLFTDSKYRNFAKVAYVLDGNFRSKRQLRKTWNFFRVFTVANFASVLILTYTGFCQTSTQSALVKIDPYQHIKLYLGDIFGFEQNKKFI